MASQMEKALAFRRLHAPPGAFVIPNPWDAGTARLLEHLGFEALATTSAGVAFALGKPDGAGAVGRNEALANAASIVAATDLPVSGDLENGYGDRPEDVAETVRRAAAAGLVGCSIEDATGRADDPIYPFDLSVERIRAAVDAARALEFPFTLTARAEGFMHGRPDLGETVHRLQAFEAAGADVLYAPGITSRDQIRTLVAAVGRPVNVLAGIGGAGFTVAELASLGVRRISVGGALARAAFGAFLDAARELHGAGTFGFADTAVPFAVLDDIFAAQERAAKR